jgi:hypothetical protein
MRHVAIAATTAFLAIAITVFLSIYGAHGVQGVVATYMGYPGGFVNWRVNPGRVSYLLITTVNWVTYFALAEVWLGVCRRGHANQ